MSRISLIATVLNEGESIHKLMQGLLSQTRQPDEIVIVDGGSSDDTVQIIESYADRLPLRIFIEAGANISAGRNRAINAASGDILAITDAGVRLEPDWLSRIVQPLLADSALAVSAGFFMADPQNVFEVALGATTLPLAHEINPQTFLPSSRSVAVRKRAAEHIGGYPQWLDYCEDLIFDLRLQASVPPFAFVPDALVHFRPRPTLRAFFKQYYRYARGDGKADLWRKRHLIRYATYLLVIPSIALLGLLLHPVLWLLYVVGAAVYLYRPYARLPVVMRLLPERGATSWLRAVLWVPVLRVTGDVAKMLGYPVGLRWRRRNNPPNWQLASASTQLTHTK